MAMYKEGSRLQIETSMFKVRNRFLYAGRAQRKILSYVDTENGQSEREIAT
jgi:hypothetical protein